MDCTGLAARRVSYLLAGVGFCLAASASPASTTREQTTDYAEARHVDAWLRHSVFGDPSFDAFKRIPGNPIHRGTVPFEWPVNGFLFNDPPTGRLYAFIGAYGKGYMNPPSHCVLYRSGDHGGSWTNLGVVLQGDPKMFDRGGHTPDVSVVYAEGRYHMVYDWGEPNFNAEGGLAYAWAERPEGPWHRAPEPITRNSVLPRLQGRYQRTYAATLIRRAHDWLILGMMDYAPNSWALFAMTATRPEGPYSERVLVRQVEADYFHPPLMEFFPAFSRDGVVYAPATSVALNRNFNALFCAPLERAEQASAWSLQQYGSLWHSDDIESEHFGIWGQTFSGAWKSRDGFVAMFPSRDVEGRGTINLAERSWKKPLRKRGFVLSSHQGPSLTLLRRAYSDFSLDARFDLRGTLRLLLDYSAPLGPNVPASDATLHPLMNTRYLALELTSSGWSVLKRDALGAEQILGTGRLQPRTRRAIRLERKYGALGVSIDGRQLWRGDTRAGSDTSGTGLIGLRLEPSGHLLVDRFRVRGESQPACMSFLWTEALLGAGESVSNWGELKNESFRYGQGVVSRAPSARAKWNISGHSLALWSPRGPSYGLMEVLLDGRSAAVVDLRSESDTRSKPVWSAQGLPDTFHTVVLVARSGVMPVDSLEVRTGP